MSQHPHIITLLTDFGIQDGFVGIMKGVILGINPGACLVDLSHAVPPQEILAGALVLRSVVPFFPPGTIHVAVVDPGVGSERRAILAATESSFFIGPDNGLLSLAIPESGVKRLIHLTNPAYMLPQPGQTFHGRDVFAPVAAHLSRGVPLEQFGPPIPTLERLRLPATQRTTATIRGSVIYIDHFGNLITNITEAELLPFPRKQLSVSIASVHIPNFASTYAAVDRGAFAALINSWGMLEIAVRNGSAAQQLGIQPGCPVSVMIA